MISAANITGDYHHNTFSNLLFKMEKVYQNLALLALLALNNAGKLYNKAEMIFNSFKNQLIQRAFAQIAIVREAGENYPDRINRVRFPHT